MTELTGQQITDLREGLQKGFPDGMRLTMFLREQLNRQLNDYASQNDPLRTAVFRVIEGAQAEGWVKDLALAAYRARPNWPQIVKVANELGLVIFSGTLSNDRPLAGGAREHSVGAELQSLLSPGRPQFDPVDLRKILVDYPARVCKIEIPLGSGTGFLIGPDLVLTNYHVMEPVLRNDARAQDVICRFDHIKKDDGPAIGNTLECRLASPAWCVAQSPVSSWDRRLAGDQPSPHELDYCLIRLADRIGEARLGGASDAAVAKRGWLALNPLQSAGQMNEQLFILSHPGGAVLKLSIGDHLGSIGASNRIRYDVNTQKGSSGSPIFNARLEVIGMHNSGWKDAAELAADGRKANQGIPISNIVEHLRGSGVVLPAIAA